MPSPPTSRGDLWVFAALAVVVVGTTWALRPRLFAVANDEEYARATGMRVTALNITLAVLTAVTVVVAMRVVGLLLISALMIVPNAAAQLLAGSFRSAIRVAVLIGVLSSVGGVATSFYADTPSGGTIVLHRDRGVPAQRRHRRGARPPARPAPPGGRAARPRARQRVRPPRRRRTTTTSTTSTTGTATPRTGATTTSTSRPAPTRGPRLQRPGPRDDGRH